MSCSRARFGVSMLMAACHACRHVAMSFFVRLSVCCISCAVSLSPCLLLTNRISLSMSASVYVRRVKACLMLLIKSI